MQEFLKVLIKYLHFTLSKMGNMLTPQFIFSEQTVIPGTV